MPLTKIDKKSLLPILLVILLLFVSIACANMLIPSYAAVKEEFNIPEALIAIPDAFFILISAGFALMWGYFTDRIDRGKVIMAGAFSWTIGMLLTAFSWSYPMLIVSRILSGAGLGCVLPVGYSIISDAIPPDERSGWFGTLAILSSVSNGIGQAMSAFLGPILSWRFPFLLLASISIVIIIFLFFIKIPQRGASEQELAELAELNLEYSYRISSKDLSHILKKNTNRCLIIQGFFSIIPGTILVYFLNFMFADEEKGFFADLPNSIQVQTSAIFAGMVGIGYILGNVVLAYLGDVLYRRNRRNRARLATFCMITSIPLAIAMMFFIQPIKVSKLGIDYPDPIPTEEIWHYIFLTIGAIFTAYPGYGLFFAFALIASILSAGPVANRNAVMIDVNLPEHKGTAASLFNLSEQIGKGLTLLISFTLITLMGSIYNMIIVSFFFWIPAAFLWYIASRNVEMDMHDKSRILSERKQSSLIDFIFELEIEMDRAIQKIHDSKYYLENNPKKFMKLINDGIKIFSRCEREGDVRSITEIEKKAHILKLRALMLKKDAKEVYRQFKKEDLGKEEKEALLEALNQLRQQIDEWEKSTLGKIQTFYEDAHLKIIEARLLRKTDILSCIRKISEAYNIYERVLLLLKERIDETNEKTELTEEEEIMFSKEKELLEKCLSSLKATETLKKGLADIINQLKHEGIKRDDLIKVAELTSEYQVDISKIIIDTFAHNGTTKKRLIEILDKIEEIFNEYDKWREKEFKVY
ncbi:MAG: MFS transporter [Promethearchaeia archaeon]